MFNRLIRRAAPIGALAATAALAVAGPASAGIWTPVATGTTSDITAVDYVAAGTIVYGTAGGAILKGGVVKSNNPGLTVNKIAFNPAGTVGLAALNGGRLLRTVNGGETWTTVSLTNSTRNQSTPCTTGATTAGTPTGNLTGVSWGDNSTAYVVGDDKGMVLKTTNGGASFTDVSRQSNGSCRVGADDVVLHDVVAVSPDVVYVVTNYFGERYFSSDGIASSAALQNDSSVNCYVENARIGIDAASPNRIFAADACTGNLSMGYSSSSGSSFTFITDIPNGDSSSLTGLNDVSVAGGSALIVGNGGTILVDPDGPTAYMQKADGVNQTSAWLAASKLDGADAVVAGRNGQMVISTQANTIPDLVAPSGGISGPTTVTAGTSAVFTANVADNLGGSGIDPASFVWTGDGIPSATGNPATLTFPNAGYTTITVTYKDIAGNVATATYPVVVNAPRPVPPVVPVVTPKPVKTTTATADGARISLGTPNTCVAPGATFKVTLTWKKEKKKGNRFVKVRRADFYIGSKRVKIDTRAPFTQTLKVTASTKKGSTVTVKARAYIKVTHGRSPTKSIKSTLRVCG